MRDYSVLDKLNVNSIDVIREAFELGIKQGIQEGKEISYSQVDMEQEYQKGFLEGQKSIVLTKELKNVLSHISEHGTYEDGLNDLWASVKHMVHYSFNHNADKFMSNLNRFLNKEPRRAMTDILAIRSKYSVPKREFSIYETLNKAVKDVPCAKGMKWEVGICTNKDNVNTYWVKPVKIENDGQ